MKRITQTFFALLLSTLINAQTPEGFKYQAVVRDANSNIITNQTIGMQISILQASITGTSVYTETFAPTSNSFGLVNLEIGMGTTSDDFSAIDWSTGPYFIEIAIDVTGGTLYAVMGTSQLMSVPYALHAKTAENINGSIAETDPVFGASVASFISVTDTTNWNSKLDSYTETDPIFENSLASGITDEDTALWNNKLESFTETDPVYELSIASAITETDTLNWNNKSDFSGNYNNLSNKPVSISEFELNAQEPMLMH